MRPIRWKVNLKYVALARVSSCWCPRVFWVELSVVAGVLNEASVFAVVLTLKALTAPPW